MSRVLAKWRARSRVVRALLDNVPGRVAAVFLAMAMLTSAFSEWIAADVPIACKFHGTFYVLPALTQPEELADYTAARFERERGPGDFAIWPLVRSGPNTERDGARSRALKAPTWVGAHPLGTDSRGRDVASRLAYGARTTFGFALLAVLAFATAGTLLGAAAGFFRGLTDTIVSRAVEIVTAFPALILVLVVRALVPHASSTTLVVAIALTQWPEITRLVRSQTLAASEHGYVVGARALGATPWRILVRHVLPNVAAPVLVAAAFGTSQVVLLETAVSFLGFGVPDDTPSWGALLADVRSAPQAWWLLVIPGIVVGSTVIATNVMAGGLQTALDPTRYADADADSASG